MTGETHEFGLGVFECNFPTRATQFFREQKLPGPYYNDMNSGGYLTWDDPSGKEASHRRAARGLRHTVFRRTREQLLGHRGLEAEADERNIQTVILFHRTGRSRGLHVRGRRHRRMAARVLRRNRGDLRQGRWE